MGQLDRPLQIRMLRRDLARLKTVLREKETAPAARSHSRLATAWRTASPFGWPKVSLTDTLSTVIEL